MPYNVNDLRVVWWSAGHSTLHIHVKDIEEAKVVLATLALRDLSLDDCITDNAGFVEIFTEAQEWECHVNDDGSDIDDGPIFDRLRGVDAPSDCEGLSR